MPHYVRDEYGMSKADRVRLLLDQGLHPNDIAEKVKCSRAHVYRLRNATRELTVVRHAIATLQEDLREVRDRLAALEESAGLKTRPKRHARKKTLSIDELEQQMEASLKE